MNLTRNYDRLPEPVGSSPYDVSPFGLHDMGGNFSEWVAAPVGEAENSLATPSQESDEQAVVYTRAGSFILGPVETSAVARMPRNPDLLSMESGFRCVRV